jgi:hypothetical protein
MTGLVDAFQDRRGTGANGSLPILLIHEAHLDLFTWTERWETCRGGRHGQQRRRGRVGT